MPGGDFELPEGIRRSGMPQTDLSAHKKRSGVASSRYEPLLCP